MGEVLDFLKFKEQKERQALLRKVIASAYGFDPELTNISTKFLGTGLGFCACCEQIRGFDERCNNEKCPAFMGPSKEGA